MRKAIVAVCLTVTLAPLGTLAQAGKDKGALPQLGKSDIKAVIRAMTVEEKARLLVGMGMNLNIPGMSIDPEDKKIAEKVPGAAGRTHAIARLGIPSLTLSDGPAGVRIAPVRKGETRTYYATGFPVATLLASSWDTDLVRRVGAALGSEAREYGVDIMLSPSMNIHRNPLGGRNFEYYSEDPLVAGKLAAAYVQGVQSNGVGTSIKHFAANNQEFNRMQSNTIVSQRALREIYLKGFEIAVKEAQPWTVMSSYNLINGTYTSQSRELLTTILRGEWGFKGFVTTDWFGGVDPVAQMKSGNDMIMPGNPDQTKAIVQAVANGSLSQQQLDENVERVLNVILQSPTFKQVKYSSQPDLKANARVARDAAAEGMVLLKNEGRTLPLASARKLALFGNTSYELIAGGTGSGDVNKAYVISLEQGLTAAGFALDPAMKKTYTDYIADQKAKRPKPQMAFMLPPPIPEMPVEAASIEQQANAADVAIITIGRNAGEFADRKIENDFTLSASEQSLIKNVADAFHAKGKKVIVVLNVGGVTEIASWRDRADAILLAWQPGQEGGYAIADVLSGKVNPSGKLATTFPVSYEEVPSAKNFPGRELVGQKSQINNPFGGKPAEVTYEEGIFVGYRYYNTFNVKPAYEFGYGLSYTDFSYGKLKLSSNQLNGKVTATVTVTNTGKVPGKEVTQLYVSAPAKKLSKPASELKAFAKTGLLQSGGSQTLTFTLSAADLASFDTASSSWVAEAGAYTIKVGASSLNIKQSAPLTLKQDVVVETVSRVLVPQVEISEMKP
ncbi:MAG TPA: glycoside hydrolase family 3 C-terminal domain-containing protein [Blastocatellia bacterium]|nr:glycoside hydrolase family 3 C-terminal domain-containing protein [Blastocatellia bacterium]